MFLGVANYSNNLRKGTWYTRRRENALYFQDNYKVTSRLNLRLGLRWEFSPFMHDKHDVAASYDPKQRAYVLGQSLQTLYTLGATLPSLINSPDHADRRQIHHLRSGRPAAEHGERQLEGYRSQPRIFLSCIRRGQVLRDSRRLRDQVLSGSALQLERHDDRQYAVQRDVSEQHDGRHADTDGIANYAMRSVPTIIAGKNSQDAVSLSTARGLTPTSGTHHVFQRQSADIARTHLELHAGERGPAADRIAHRVCRHTRHQ